MLMFHLIHVDPYMNVSVIFNVNINVECAIYIYIYIYIYMFMFNVMFSVRCFMIHVRPCENANVLFM